MGLRTVFTAAWVPVDDARCAKALGVLRVARLPGTRCRFVCCGAVAERWQVRAGILERWVIAGGVSVLALMNSAYCWLRALTTLARSLFGKPVLMSTNITDADC
jgi:hypothetical protein